MKREEVKSASMALETNNDLPVGRSVRGHLFRGAASDFEFCESADDDWVNRNSRTYVVHQAGDRIRSRVRLLPDGRYRLTITTPNRLESIPVKDFLDLQHAVDESMNYLGNHLLIDRKEAAND